MFKFKNIFLFYIGTFSFFNVLSQTTEVPKYRILPSQSFGGHTSDFFDSVEYIPLETNKESIFGDIYQLIITDSSYVVSDIDTESILFFSHNGKFHTRLKDFAKIYHNKINNTLELLSFSSNQTKLIISTYSVWGKLMSRDTIEISATDKYLARANLIPYGDDYYLSCNDCWASDAKSTITQPCYFLSVFHGDKLVKNLLPVSESISNAVSKIKGNISAPILLGGRDFYVSTPLDYNIYRVNTDTAIKVCQFVFPLNRVLPKSLIESQDNKLLDSVSRSLRQSTSFITNVENIFFNKSKLFFKISTPAGVLKSNNSANEYQYNFVLDTLTKKLVSLDRITPDFKSHFLPLMGENSKGKGFLPYKGYLYSYMSSSLIFSAKNSTVGKKPVYPQNLQEYFQSQNKKSNPVLVRMKLKD